MSKNGWLKKLIVAVMAVELVYVIVFNLALQLPATQSFLNQLRPDKFYVTWESAWTWYPFRFHFTNASGNGQSRSQQWEFESKAVSASIDALPLLFKRVWINRVRLADSSYSQRPRLKQGKDYAELIDLYPPISGREISDAVTAPLKKKRAWHIDIEDIRLDGEYRYWVHQFKGGINGTLRADINAVSRGGLFSMRARQINLEFDRHFTGASREMFRHGEISGKLEFLPFIPRENRGSKMLQYLLIETDLGIELNDLGFIEPLVAKYKHLEVNGKGKVAGHLHMEAGKVLAGTDLAVDANDLEVNLVSHTIDGNGAIRINTSKDDDDRLNLEVRFNDMVVNQAGGTQPLLTGQGLLLNGTSDNELIQVGSDNASSEAQMFKDKLKEVELRLKIPTARVADMAVFNHYMPPGAPLSFTNGLAEVQADISLGHEDANGYLRLMASDMEALVDEQSIRADFSADISVTDGNLDELTFDISGSTLRLDKVKVTGEQQSFNQKDWATTLTFTHAETALLNPFSLKTDAVLHMTDSRPIVAMLGNQKDRPDWIDKMLTIEDVNAAIELDFVNPRLMIPIASMDSDKIELGAKGIISKDQRDGIIYARYKKLDIVVKITDGKRNIDLTGARRKFDEY